MCYAQGHISMLLEIQPLNVHLTDNRINNPALAPAPSPDSPLNMTRNPFKSACVVLLCSVTSYDLQGSSAPGAVTGVKAVVCVEL